MGVIRQGANGGFRGKAGSVIGSSWKSIQYIKGLYKKRTKPATEEQLIAQEKFRILMRFLLPIRKFINIGFGQKATRILTPTNYAFQQNFGRAIQGIYPDFTLDYSQIILAEGYYGGVGTMAASHTDGDISVTWSTVQNEVYETQDDDRVYILGYHPVKDEFITAPTVPVRADGQVTFGVPLHLQSDSVHIWLFVSDRKRTSVSRSSYLGELDLS